MRRVYILERSATGWWFTLPTTSRIARLAIRVPIRWRFFAMESARLGDDTTSYVTIKARH